jgi:uncharacterized protein YndB with AHSA1/START domain
VHRIRIQSFVAAERAAVWDALVCRTDVVLDALPGARWPEPHVAEPPRRLAAPWPHTASAGGPTEVAVALEATDGGTRLDLEHRGFGEGPAWEEAVGGHFAGWLQALAALGVLVESGVDARCAPALRGRERYFASGEIPAGADAVWRSITDPYVIERWSDGVLDGAVASEAIEARFLRVDLPASELTLILRRTPRGTHLALAEYGVVGRDASTRWPPLFERLTRHLL